jgi:hypothetical protein
MSTPLSEVINLLNFEGTIDVDDSFETGKVLLQEFGSMSITVRSDQNLILTLSYSNNGINYDYNSNTSIQANTPITITSVILGKWTKILLTNFSISIANVRLTTYCQIIPIALQTQITKQGNQFPSVNVDNLAGTIYNDLRTASKIILHDMKFNSTVYDDGTTTLYCPDRQISYNNSGTLDANSKIYINNNVLNLSDISYGATGTWMAIENVPVIFGVGYPIYVEFSACFATSGYTNANIFGYNQNVVGVGYIDGSTGFIKDGFYLGFPSSPAPPDTIIDEIALIYYNNYNETYVTRTKWIFDTLYGDGPSGITLNENTLSMWRIRSAYPINSIYLEYHNITDNTWIPCHRIQLENLTLDAIVTQPSLGINMFSKKTTYAGITGSNNTGVGCGGACSGVEIGTSYNRFFPYAQSNSSEVALVANTPGYVFTIRNGPTLNGSLNRTNIRIASISGYCPTNTKLELYRNFTLMTDVWVNPSPNYDPTEYLSSGTVNSDGYNIKIFYQSNAFNIDITSTNNFLYYLDTFSVKMTSPTSGNAIVSINYYLYI